MFFLNTAIVDTKIEYLLIQNENYDYSLDKKY